VEWRGWEGTGGLGRDGSVVESKKSLKYNLIYIVKRDINAKFPAVPKRRHNIYGPSAWTIKR